MTSDVADDELQALHTRLHAAVIGRALDFVATLTTLEPEAVARDWRAFREAFDAHAAAEEEVVFPAAAGLALPPKGDLAMLARDHALLREAIAAVEDLLAALAAAPVAARRALLARHLDRAVRLHKTLEHHQDREDQIFYPQAAAELDRAARSRIVAALVASAR